MVKKQIDSKMVCLGDDQTYTAMAKQWTTCCNSCFTNIEWKN
jgi:hypothetical protein